MYVSVDLCVVPLGVGLSLSKYIAQCEKILTSYNLTCHLHAYGTNVEGEWDVVFRAIKACHEDLHKSDTDIKDLEIPMLCFYQHHDETESGNKELKNIIINDSTTIALKQLVKNRFFQRALHRDE